MATKYLIFPLHGNEPLDARAKKDAAIKVGEATGKDFRVETESGTVVFESAPTPEPVEDLIGDTPAPTPEAEPTGETLTAKQKRTIRFAESDASRDFPGNYSIVMAPLAQDIAEAFGGIETEVQTFPGKLVRRVHFYGAKANIDAFLKVLDPIVAGAQPHLNEWQKKNLDKRRGKTDMQKYLEHREVIAKYGKSKAREVKKGEHG
jgi:hypothetical protein